MGSFGGTTSILGWHAATPSRQARARIRRISITGLRLRGRSTESLLALRRGVEKGVGVGRPKNGDTVFAGGERRRTGRRPLALCMELLFDLRRQRVEAGSAIDEIDEFLTQAGLRILWDLNRAG